MKLHNETWRSVSVLHDGLIARFCYDGWDDKDADVVCRETGFLHGQFYNHNSDWIMAYKTDIVPR